MQNVITRAQINIRCTFCTDVKQIARTPHRLYLRNNITEQCPYCTQNFIVIIRAQINIRCSKRQSKIYTTVGANGCNIITHVQLIFMSMAWWRNRIFLNLAGIFTENWFELVALWHGWHVAIYTSLTLLKNPEFTCSKGVLWKSQKRIFYVH